MSEKLEQLKLTGAKELVVISGVSGCGKTTLAKKLAMKYHIHILSLDACKAELGIKFGFLTEFEKKIFNDAAKENFKLQCITQIRTQESIIVEYPFSQDWQSFFSECARSYGYKLIVINLVAENFDSIYKIRMERDKQSYRPKVLLSDVWIPDKMCHCPDDAEVRQHMYDQWSSKDTTQLVGDETYDVDCEEELW